MSLDEEIERAENTIGSMSLSDANLRLAVTMTRLTDNVSTLSGSVSTLTGSVQTLTQDINGGSGVRTEIKDLRRDLRDTNSNVDGLANKMNGAQKMLWRVVWFLCIVGIITLISDMKNIAPLLIKGLE